MNDTGFYPGEIVLVKSIQKDVYRKAHVLFKHRDRDVYSVQMENGKIFIQPRETLLSYKAPDPNEIIKNIL